MLSKAFTYINSTPLPNLGFVEERDEFLGSQNSPSLERKEMDRFGSRFGGGGRFNRGGRDGWQYRKKEEGNDGYRNYNPREVRRDWSQGAGNGRSHDRQEFQQDQERQEINFGGDVAFGKGRGAQEDGINTGKLVSAAGETSKAVSGPDLAQQQQLLAALLAQLTQGNTLIGAGLNFQGGSSSVQ